MQLCKKCGKPVRYVAGGFNRVYECEVDARDVVSKGGHFLKAYPLHECEKKTADGTIIAFERDAPDRREPRNKKLFEEE